MFPCRRPDPLEQLLRARFTAFVTGRDGLHYMVSVTRLVVVVRVFAGAVSGDPARTWHFERRDVPEQLHDGQGWNLRILDDFLTRLGDTGSDDKETRMQKSKRILALYASMARMTRRKQRGGSCVMLPCQAIRRHIPALSGETVKFFLLAAANGDDLGVAFGATDYFWGLGYHPEKSGKRMRELESLGLMRYLRKDAFDPVTRRRMKDVYQFNPELYYVRKGRRAAALALSETPFFVLPTHESQIGKPDRVFRSISDHNQNLYPPPESSSKNQSQVSKSMNHHHHQNSAFERGDGRDWNRDSDNYPQEPTTPAPGGAKHNSQVPTATTPAAQAANQTPAPHGATNPQPPSSGRPPSRKADFEQPLADSNAEQLAQDIKRDFGTRLWQARELVDGFGAAYVSKARDMVIDEKRKRFVKTEIGLMRYWLEKGMIPVEDQTRPYDPNAKYGFAASVGD